MVTLITLHRDHARRDDVANGFELLTDRQKLRLLDTEDQATVEQEFFSHQLDDGDRASLVALLGEDKPLNDVQWHYFRQAWAAHLERAMKDRDADARVAYENAAMDDINVTCIE